MLPTREQNRLELEKAICALLRRTSKNSVPISGAWDADEPKAAWFTPRSCRMQTTHNLQLRLWDHLISGQSTDACLCWVWDCPREVLAPAGFSPVVQHQRSHSHLGHLEESCFSPSFSICTLLSMRKKKCGWIVSFPSPLPTKIGKFCAVKTQVDCFLRLAGLGTNTGLDSSHTLFSC